jgi:hypothetical protein
MFNEDENHQIISNLKTANHTERERNQRQNKKSEMREKEVENSQGEEAP